jgi:Pin2-interacting protein X1
MVGTDLASVNEILGIASPAGSSSPAPLEVPATADTINGTTAAIPSALSVYTKDEERTRKRKRGEETGDKAARKEAKRLAKDAKREEKRKRKEKPTEAVVDTSTDPSFAAGGGMKVSTLSVHDYLSNQLMKRRAALVRRKREEEASLWNRAAAICA